MMNEKGLIEQVLRIINANYSNIYVIDIIMDKVYKFDFTVTNSLVIRETTTYTDFIDIATRFVHNEEVSKYFEAISLNKLETEAQKGNSETKVKYRKLCETGEYRWFVNIINYLPFEDRKLIFMMSEDVNERLIDSEENNIKLETEVVNYKNRINRENASISNAVYQINNLLDNGYANDNNKMQDTRKYINSVFNQLSIDHPELNKAIIDKQVISSNYKKPSILIVDDSSIIRNSLKRIFVNEYGIIFAKNGEEAINIIQENMVDSSLMKSHENIVGVLLDLVMPGTDGFEVLKFMKNFNLLNRIPVAIISGDETRETRKKVYEYDIVDMLEKPFNTDVIKRRITKLINLHMSSNNLMNIVENQKHQLSNIDDIKNSDNIKLIINQIIDNIVNSAESKRLKKMVKIVATNLSNKSEKYGLDNAKIDNIVNTCALYNIGAIAIDENEVITNKSIRKEIEYGLTLINNYLHDESERLVAENIIKNSCEFYDGTGYPNGIVGDNIPVEAQITNIVVRLMKYMNGKTLPAAVKIITEKDASRYSKELIEVLKSSKKELKEIN